MMDECYMYTDILNACVIDFNAVLPRKSGKKHVYCYKHDLLEGVSLKKRSGDLVFICSPHLLSYQEDKHRKITTILQQVYVKD